MLWLMIDEKLSQVQNVKIYVKNTDNILAEI